MPVIKIYGFSNTNLEGDKVREKIDQKIGSVFAPGDAGTVLIPSDCRVCDKPSEVYRYLEIIITDSGNKEKIISALKELHLGLDVIFIQHDKDGYIPADEMV